LGGFYSLIDVGRWRVILGWLCWTAMVTGDGAAGHALQRRGLLAKAPCQNVIAKLKAGAIGLCRTLKG